MPAAVDRVSLQKSVFQLVFTNFSAFKEYFEFIIPDYYPLFNKIDHFTFMHDIKIFYFTYFRRNVNFFKAVFAD